MEGIIISDVEGVLLDAEFLPRLANHEGKEKIVQEITEKGIKGDITWEDGLMRRIEILEGANYGDALKVGEDMPYTKGAMTFCQELKKRGYTLVGVTGGFTIFSERIREELDLDYMLSNTLRFKDGKLAGIDKLQVGSESIEGLGEILEKEEAKRKEVTAVADGANNLKLFEHADRKIAFNAQPIIKEHADVIVDSGDLRDALKCILDA